MALMINGERFNVELSSLGRSYRKEYKYRVTTEDGVVHSELRAVYLDFDLALGNVDNVEYDRLIRLLRKATGDCTIVLPSGSVDSATYQGEFGGIKDEVITQDGDTTLWDNLTLSFTGTVPLGVEQ